MLIYTIGYGNRAISDFILLLRRYNIQMLIDTRSLPYSRFQPNFRKKALQDHLEKAGIDYLYLGEALGGKRVDPDCLVDGKVDLDRLAAKPYFQAAIAQVEALVRGGETVVLMCAELRPETCHRSWMLAPQMLARGIQVLHIDENGETKNQQEVRGWFEDA